MLFLMQRLSGMLFMGVLMWGTFCLDTGRKGFFEETYAIFAFAVFAVCRCSDKTSDILERIKKDKEINGSIR